MSDKSNDTNNTNYISPDSIELNCVQFYQGNRTRPAGKFMITIQQIPEDPNADDPIVLRLSSNLAPDIILFGQRVELSMQEYRFLRILAEQPNRVVSGQEIYEELFSLYSDVLGSELRKIKHRILKKLQTQFGKTKISESFIETDFARGFQLRLKRWQIEVV